MERLINSLKFYKKKIILFVTIILLNILLYIIKKNILLSY